MIKKLITFNNDPAIKEKYLARLRLHEAQDEIIQGTYWENGKGCAVGCTIHGDSHDAYEDELGISRIIARLEDGIFEGLPNDRAKSFPRIFLEAVPVGVDIGIVFYQFMHWLLVDKDDGIIKYVKFEKSICAINKVADLFLRKIEIQEVSDSEFIDASAAARAAAYDAADAYAVYDTGTHAADYTAADVAADAADASAYTADTSAYIAARTYAAYDARTDGIAAAAAAEAIEAAYADPDYAAEPIVYAVRATAHAADVEDKTEDFDVLIKNAHVKQADKLIELIKACGERK